MRFAARATHDLVDWVLAIGIFVIVILGVPAEAVLRRLAFIGQVPRLARVGRRGQLIIGAEGAPREAALGIVGGNGAEAGGRNEKLFSICA
ncbi:MAG: hypothetical protein WCC90_02960 [Methylocella sp.]